MRAQHGQLAVPAEAFIKTVLNSVGKGVSFKRRQIVRLLYPGCLQLPDQTPFRQPRASVHTRRRNRATGTIPYFHAPHARRVLGMPVAGNVNSADKTIRHHVIVHNVEILPAAAKASLDDLTERQCRPTDIILGDSAPSAYSTSKLSFRY